MRPSGCKISFTLCAILHTYRLVFFPSRPTSRRGSSPSRATPTSVCNPGASHEPHCRVRPRRCADDLCRRLRPARASAALRPADLRDARRCVGLDQRPARPCLLPAMRRGVCEGRRSPRSGRLREAVPRDLHGFRRGPSHPAGQDAGAREADPGRDDPDRPARSQDPRQL